MRSTAFTIAAAAILSVAIAAADGVKTNVKFDQKASLKGARTYTWLESPPYVTNAAPDIVKDERLEKEALDAPIRSAIDRALAERGWRPVAAANAPEFQVVYYGFMTAGADASVLGSFYQYTTGWGPAIYGEGGLPTTSYTIVEKGTLVIDIVDPARKTAVWRGTASGTMDRTREQSKRIEIITDAVNRLFKKFPPR